MTDAAKLADAMNALPDLGAMAKEKLDPVLEMYYRDDPVLGPFVRHPLVYGSAALPGMLNRALKVKTEYLDQAIRDKQWDRALWVYERPYRLTILRRWVATGMITTDVLRDLLPHAWTDTELPYQFKGAVRYLFTKAGFVTDAPTLWVNALSRSPSLTVWRGDSGRPSPRRGSWSWSLARGMGAWYARRWAKLGATGPRLWRGTITPADAWAYFEGRGEAEIVIDPRLVRDISAEQLGAPE